MRRERRVGFRLKFAASVLLAIAASGVFINNASATDDWGSVIQTIFKHKLNDRLTFVLFPEVRFKDDSKDFYYQQYRGGFDYEVNKNLELEILYHYSETKTTSGSQTGKWSYENRIILGATPMVTFAGLDFSDRNRIEYRYIGQDDPFFRYRNEIKAEKAVKFFGIKFKPFVSYEVFYDLKADKSDLNRFQVGFSKRLSKYFSYSLFYRRDMYNPGKKWGTGRSFIGFKSVINY